MGRIERNQREGRTDGGEPDAFLPLTPLSYHILLAVADQPRHGYGIIKEIEAGTGGATSPSTGALYLALQRMEGEGLVAEAPAPAGETADDPRRKYYRLTPMGRRVAVAESRRLAELVALAAEKRLTGGRHV
jgi:DNA-binding PadR family transcriptional regulator